MQQCRVTTAVTQPKEEVTVVGCFFFEKKKKEKRKETSCFKLDNPERFFLMVKKCYCFYKRKWLNILHIDWTNTYKRSRSTRLLTIFRQSAKGDVICSKQIRDFLSPHKRKQMDCLLIKPHLQLKRWKNMSNTKLKSFLSLSHLKGSLTSLLT